MGQNMSLTLVTSNGLSSSYKNRPWVSSGKSAHANMDIVMCYDVIKDVHVCGEFGRPHININTVSMVQDME